jgi:MoaA/NifB/PqqE/SkfB family radical SAM enzyme
MYRKNRITFRNEKYWIMPSIRKENQIYDIWLRWRVLANRCNLNCAYCFRYQVKNKLKKREKVSKINIPALMRMLNETDKTYRITFTGGGEPFLVPNIIEGCKEITKNHFISLNTNLTLSRITEFSKKIDPERVLFIHASLHIKELKRLNLLKKYINNYRLCKDKGFNIRASEVAHPSLLDEIEKYRRFFQEEGIHLYFTPFKGRYNGKAYPDSYTEKEIGIFGFDINRIDQFRQRGRLCNAGYNVADVSPKGNVTPCFRIQKSIGNVYQKVEFNSKLIRCPFEFCGSPLKIYDPYLLKKAKEQSNSKIVSPLRLKNELFIGNIKNKIVKIPRSLILFINRAVGD